MAITHGLNKACIFVIGQWSFRRDSMFKWFAVIWIGYIYPDRIQQWIALQLQQEPIILFMFYYKMILIHLSVIYIIQDIPLDLTYRPIHYILYYIRQMNMFISTFMSHDWYYHLREISVSRMLVGTIAMADTGRYRGITPWVRTII